MGHPPLYFNFSVHLFVWLSVCPFVNPPIRPSVCPSGCLSVCLSVAHHISGTVHDVIIIFGTHVENNDMYRHIFHFFKIGQKQSKMTKNSVRCAPYLRSYTSYDWHLWYTFVKWLYLQVFFSCFQNFDLLVVTGVKVQKMVQKDKKFCVTLHISGTIHHMIVIYGAHV